MPYHFIFCCYAPAICNINGYSPFTWNKIYHIFGGQLLRPKLNKLESNNQCNMRKEALVLLPQPNYFNFWAIKLAHKDVLNFSDYPSINNMTFVVHAKQ